MNATSPEVCKAKFAALEDVKEKIKKAKAMIEEGPPTSFLEVAAWQEVLDGWKESLDRHEELEAEGAILAKEEFAELRVTTPLFLLYILLYYF